MEDRVQLQERLARAEQHVTAGEYTVARQREIAAELERDGHDAAAAQARRLLAQFEKTLVLHVADRDRLRKELGLQ